MSYYFVAQIRITDEIEYQKYLDNAEDIFRKYKGEYLSVDNNPDSRRLLELYTYGTDQV